MHALTVLTNNNAVDATEVIYVMNFGQYLFLGYRDLSTTQYTFESEKVASENRRRIIVDRAERVAEDHIQLYSDFTILANGNAIEAGIVTRIITDLEKCRMDIGIHRMDPISFQFATLEELEESQEKLLADCKSTNYEPRETNAKQLSLSGLTNK